MVKASNNAMVITVPKSAHVEMDDGIIKIVLKQNFNDDFDARFPVIPASKLSLTDKFMSYVPRTLAQEIMMKRLKKIIKESLKDFRVSAIDPSFNNDGKIVYKAGLRPAVGKYSYWWNKKLKEFMPKKRSRMGTKTQYLAFCGYIIKFLVSNGWKVSSAWEAVCDESKGLGHYKDSKKAKNCLEPTGSRRIGLFCDLANTGKIMKNDSVGSYDYFSFVRTNTNYTNHSGMSPLVYLQEICDPTYVHRLSVGWMVLDV